MDIEQVREELEGWLDNLVDDGFAEFELIDNVDSMTIICPQA